MNWNLGEEHTGARKLFREALSARNSERFFYPLSDFLSFAKVLHSDYKNLRPVTAGILTAVLVTSAAV